MTDAPGEGPTPPQYPPYQPPPPYPSQPHQPYGWAPYPVPPTHPNATVALVLGIVGLATIPVLCCFGLFLSPVAWYLGGKAVREIDAAPHHYSGRSQARAGQVLGIVGTVLLVLSVIAIVFFFGLIATGDWDGDLTYNAG